MKTPDWLSVLRNESGECAGTFLFDGGTGWISMPENYDPSSGKLLLLFYGHSGSASSNNITHPGIPSQFRAELLKAGWAGAVSENGPDTWGRAETTRTASRMLDFLTGKWNIPVKIPVIGFSMGGQDAFLFSVRVPERVKTIIDVCGVTDPLRLARECLKYPFRQLLTEAYGTAPEENETPYLENSPLRHIERIKKVPVRIFHGIPDEIIDIEYSREFFRRLKKEGADVLMKEVREHGHSNDILAVIGKDILSILEEGRT